MPATTPRGVPYAISTDPIGNYPDQVSKPQAEWIDTNLGAIAAANSLRVDNTVGTRVFGTVNRTDYMLSGDTGYREISSIAESALTGGSIRIRRQNNTVTLGLRGISLASGADSKKLLGPIAGFMPPQAVSMSIYSVGTAGLRQLGTVVAEVSWGFWILPSTVFSGIWQMVEFTTDDPWPSSLPGTAA